MKVHHLNCGSIRMPGNPLICHVLLIETDKGLVLVDSGFGTEDCAEPARRIGPMRHLIRPVLDHDETALSHVRTLGFDPADVRHIVLTHFDVDHIGGLSDFAHAHVHVTKAEATEAVHHPSVRGRVRYRKSQWAHQPHLVEHEPTGEPWRGFSAARSLDAIDPGIVLIPMPGHSRGHAAVAVDAGHRWVLHCGDAFFHRGTLDGGDVPILVRTFETLVADDLKKVHANHERLAELHRRGDDDVLIVSAHDSVLLARAQESA